MSNKRLFFHLAIAFTLGVLVLIIPRPSRTLCACLFWWRVSGGEYWGWFDWRVIIGSKGLATVNKGVTEFVYNIYYYTS